MDLHALTRKLGTKAVADAIGITERALEDARRGHTALNVDHLYQLERAFPAFDLLGTIIRIGAARAAKRRAAETLEAAA